MMFPRSCRVVQTNPMAGLGFIGKKTTLAKSREIQAQKTATEAAKAEVAALPAPPRNMTPWGEADEKLKKVLLVEPALLMMRNNIVTLVGSFNRASDAAHTRVLALGKKTAARTPTLEEKLALARQYQQITKAIADYKEAEGVAMNRYVEQVQHRGQMITTTSEESGGVAFVVTGKSGEVVGTYPSVEEAKAKSEEIWATETEAEKNVFMQQGAAAERAAAVAAPASSMAKPLLIGGAAIAALMLLK